MEKRREVFTEVLIGANKKEYKEYKEEKEMITEQEGKDKLNEVVEKAISTAIEKQKVFMNAYTKELITDFIQQFTEIVNSGIKDPNAEEKGDTEENIVPPKKDTSSEDKKETEENKDVIAGAYNVYIFNDFNDLHGRTYVNEVRAGNTIYTCFKVNATTNRINGEVKLKDAPDYIYREAQPIGGYPLRDATRPLEMALKCGINMMELNGQPAKFMPVCNDLNSECNEPLKLRSISYMLILDASLHPSLVGKVLFSVNSLLFSSQLGTSYTLAEELSVINSNDYVVSIGLINRLVNSVIINDITYSDC